jgi:hypothetical protein
MTVSAQTWEAAYAGNSATTVFTITFRILAADQVTVTLYNSAGEELLRELGTDYSVSGVGDPFGLVTMFIPPAFGETLFIRRSVPLTQEKEYVEGDNFPAASHEAGLDKLTMIAQQLDGRQNALSDRLVELLAEVLSIKVTLPPWPPDNGTGPLTTGEWNGAALYLAGMRADFGGTTWYALVDNIDKQPDLSSEWDVALEQFDGGPVNNPITFPAPTIFHTSAVFPPGADPDSPVVGSFWLKTNGVFYYRFGGSNVPLVSAFVPASWIAGSIVNRSTGASVLYQNTAAQIGFDDTLPLIGEGFEVATVSHTCYAATHAVAVRASVPIGTSVALYGTLALFRDSVCIGAAPFYSPANGVSVVTVQSTTDLVVGDTSAHTYSVRIGSSAGGTIYVNGGTGGRLYAGMASAKITVEERRQ